jgi:hypothetical protein
MKRWAFLLSALIYLSSPARAQDPDAADAQARMQAAAAVVEPPFELFYVPSSGGGIAKATFLALSKGKGPSKMGKQLAAELKKPRPSLRTLVVSGPSDAITQQVVLDALNLLKEERLANLKLVFVGAPGLASELRPAVEGAGAQFEGVAFEAASNKTMEPTR